MGAATPVGAGAATPTCARTADPNTPPSPSAAKPCWTDVTPYPFGPDGNSVDPARCDSRGLIAQQGCYLTVRSMAFRAWNRGLATTADAVPTLRPSPYGLWIFNGTRWFPDPTFPGQSACAGSTVLWAGKLDYWLVGAGKWGNLCRFDGVNFQWDPLSVPPATLARVPHDAQGNIANGAMQTGACFAWDNCWFFGTFGTVVHWDGQTLSDASSGLGASPWLRGAYTEAAAGTDASGKPVAFAVSRSTDGGSEAQPQLPAQPDGSPPPQAFSSTGTAFSPLPFSPPTAPQSGNPYRTDLVAVATDADAGAWVAGNPADHAPRLGGVPGSTEPAPLLPLSSIGTQATCSGYGANTFQFNGLQSGSDSYLWTSLSVFPGSDDALAGAQYQPPAAGANFNDDGQAEPAVVLARCGLVPSPTQFRIPDPFAPASGQLIPADRTGYMTGVVANAVNDAWAATTVGLVHANPSDFSGEFERPHLYRLTDGQPPQAPAGDDIEIRPLVFTVEPPIYVQSPGVQPAPPPTQTTITRSVTTVRHKKGRPPIYGVKAGKPVRLPNGQFALKFTFKVRPPAAIGIEALRGKKVVSSTGLRHFHGRTGQLVLTLDPHQWPTRLRFILPKGAKRTRGDGLGPMVLRFKVAIPG